MRIVTRPLSDFTSDKVDLNGFAGGTGSLFVLGIRNKSCGNRSSRIS